MTGDGQDQVQTLMEMNQALGQQIDELRARWKEAEADAERWALIAAHAQAQYLTLRFGDSPTRT